MAQLAATAVAMINGPIQQVYDALIDYRETRPKLLTAEFADYEVRADDEVHWTIALDEAIRNKRGKKPKKQKGPPRECLVRVEAGENSIVERDTTSSLVTTWTMSDAGDDRTAVRVEANWEGPDGFGALMSRQKEQLALRSVYEGLLTNLHTYFDELPKDPEPEDGQEP
ncbi:hypothetical protein [Pseudonocardia spinosispora]|uniref:hypothetical protein n=1 Tax=Pseudonocardia spinosispora TaxID=103441 RepID=UPI0003F53784|nr:hypothetical protein [Pseudonocardia spinosispora]